MNELAKKLDLNKIFERTVGYAITDAGKKIIFDEIPADELNTATHLLELTFEIKSFIEEVGEIDYLYLSDLKESLYKSKIENFTLNPKEIIQIGKLITNARLIKNSIQSFKSRFPVLWTFVEQLTENRLLEKRINDIFDDYGEVKDTASEDLRKIREEIKSLQFSIQKINERLLNKLNKEGFVQDELITLRDGRMVLPIRSEFKRMVKGFIHAESASGQTTYIEPEETLELNNELLSLYFEEKREIQRILSLITKDISQISDVLLKNFEIVTLFDAHYAKAKFAIEIRGNKINFSTDHSFELIDCRHPALILTIGYDKTVPFNLKVDDSIRGLIISGPNAGGKTVLMKSIGSFAILSRMGYLLSLHPDSRIPFFKKIFIDIGDEQSIEDEISTFGSHIKNIRAILESCDFDSLVLLDELGTGTDPVQGAALAAAVIDALIEKNSFVFVTTHHSFLKFFGSNHPRLINASMEFDSKTLEPTYKFIQGIPGSSYTFEISKRMKLAPEVIEKSKKYLKRDDLKIEEYISQLHDKVQYYSQLISDLRREKEEIQKLKKELNERLSKIKIEAKEIKRKALLEADQIIQTANRLIENTIRSIRESTASKKTIKSVKQKISVEKSKLEKLIQSEIKHEDVAVEEIKIGDFVKLTGQNATGKIISIDAKKNQVLVQIDQFKVWISLDKVTRTNQNLQESPGSKYFSSIETNTIPFRLDIRGKRSNEAEEEILRYIDNATMYGLFNIEILHGKGDGILKNLTHKILQSHPFVESFSFAPIDQGGEGVTIVKLKD